MSNKFNYNPWPLGHIPKELQRPELDIIKAMGYVFDDPREVVDIFERKVAKFAGSNYAVAVDCATHAIELVLRLKLETGELNRGAVITIPNQTYISIAMMLNQLGFTVNYSDNKWIGSYDLKPTNVIDAATQWTKGMYIEDTYYCLSFQIKKRIPIGRGGMILLNNEAHYKYLKLLSYDGRDLKTFYDSKNHIKVAQGFHYYCTPEDCARGLILMDNTSQVNEPLGNYNMYPRITKMLGLE